MKTVPHMHDYIHGLPEAVLADVNSRSRERSFVKGESVYRQGEPPTSMYRVISGAVKLCNYTRDGREFIASEFRAGDCFGEMGLIDGFPRVSHAVATADCLLQIIDRKDFDALNALHSEFAVSVMLTLCRRLRFVFGLVAEAGGLSLNQRLALNLYRLSYSQGCRDETNELYVSVSQEELGRMLGTSRQTVNKELHKLVEEGSIELRYGKIYFSDLESMREKYGNLLGAEHITASYEDNR
tara:strand:+ start:97437 stop:98156 length:720 start_codon:yes stop_codon:yes gene_type:complete